MKQDGGVTYSTTRSLGQEDLLDALSLSLLEKTPSELLERDMEKLRATCDTKAVGRDGLKAAAMKRILLLLGSGGPTITGAAYKGEMGFEGKTQALSETNMPIGMFMAGHVGRAYMKLPEGQGAGVLSWIAGGEDGVHKAPYSIAANQEESLKDNEIIFDRHAASHSVESKKDGLNEKKGLIYGVTGYIGRMANPRNLRSGGIYWPLKVIGVGVSFPLAFLYDILVFVPNLLFSKPPMINPFQERSEHLGFNVAFGGAGKSYEFDKAKKITSDGKSGHVYINAKGEMIGIGMEGTAPGADGVLGVHSKTGGADRFSAGESEKFSIKFGTGMFKEYLRNYLKAANNGDVDIPVIKEYQLEVIAKYLKGEKLGGDKISKDQLKVALGDIGLPVVKQGGQDFMLTHFGAELAKANPGQVVIPNNYNGLKINNYDKANLESVKKIDIDKVPNEICYFKAQKDCKSLMKQEAIFEGIDNKPLLKNNPMLSLQSCVKINALYSIANDGNNAKKEEEARDLLNKLESGIVQSKEANKYVADTIDKTDLASVTEQVLTRYEKSGSAEQFRANQKAAIASTVDFQDIGAAVPQGLNNVQNTPQGSHLDRITAKEQRQQGNGVGIS